MDLPASTTGASAAGGTDRGNRRGSRAWLAVAGALAIAAVAGVGFVALPATPPTDGAPGAEQQSTAQPDVRAVTGAHSRVVWVQGDGTDPFAMGTGLILMGWDSDDGRGERAIVSRRGNYTKPLLSARGERVVYSTRPSQTADANVMVVDWKGSAPTLLTKGYALAVWRDPASGREWVYFGVEQGRESLQSVRRVPLDAPGPGELVWDKTRISADSFQLDRTGRLAGGLFPWPEAGVADVVAGSWRKLGEGCWTALADAGTPLFWYFDGAHRNLTMVELQRDQRWTVNITGAPGFTGAEAYHPRWSNHPRFLTITGPYNQGGQNQVRSGGAQAEVWIGRFAGDYSRVEAWARVTRNSGGDAYPDVWIDSARSPFDAKRSAASGPKPGSSPAPPDGGRVTMSARLIAPGAIPSPRSIAPYRHALVTNLYEVVRLTSGSYSGQRILVAQWAIRDGQVLTGARRAAGTTYELTLEPYDAHPELEGERLIMGEEAAGLRLFYDVGPIGR